MGYRNIVVEGSGKLYCNNEQLIFEGAEQHRVPLEDINSVLIESQQSTITTACLSKLVEAKVTLFVCDDKHLPNGVMFSYSQHSRQLGIMKLQDRLTAPAKKRIWQQIIRAKIANQAFCLQYCGLDDGANYLQMMEQKVTTGDDTHLEAPAAAYYFRTIFGKGFSRNDDADGRNQALNYGYAIFRGQLARLIATYGFFPSYGIYHRSELNAFNLADDLMEPFRPVVDLYVATNVQEDKYLNTQIKHDLYNLLNVDAEVGGQKYSVCYAAEKLVQSLSKCMEDYQVHKLLVPKLLQWQQHSYE